MAAARSRGTIALSSDVYAEVSEVLSRPKFTSLIGEDRRREILELLSAAALWIEPVETISDCRDVKDNRYLELALAAAAAIIVSGDDDLLTLDPWRGVRVLNPADFIAELPV